MVTLTGSFVSVALLISGNYTVVFVRFDLFCLLFWVLVDILINVTNFLRNESFVYIFDGEKTMPIFGKIKFVCKLIHLERDDAENVATRKYIKTKQTCMKVIRICLCGVRGEERYNQQQSFTTVSRQGHIVVKVLALWQGCH